jgi:hypothetical protein
MTREGNQILMNSHKLFEVRCAAIAACPVMTGFKEDFGMQDNKSFKYVPGLRPSTGHKNAAHFYAA